VTEIVIGNEGSVVQTGHETDQETLPPERRITDQKEIVTETEIVVNVSEEIERDPNQGKEEKGTSLLEAANTESEIVKERETQTQNLAVPEAIKRSGNERIKRKRAQL